MTAQRELSLIVAFGTDMGNSEDAAMTFAEAAAPLGIEAGAVELNQLNLADLQTATHFVVVVSTFGDGEFPDTATLFWEAISGDTERLEHLNFAVLALGDISYDLFCNAGKLLDERLEALGATRLVDRVDIDGHYEQPAKAWTSDVLKLLAAELSTPAPAVAATAPPQRVERHVPVEARLAVNRLLNAPESDKEVRHYELDLTGTEISYQAGDSIAVHATNDPALVEELLAELGVDADFAVADHDQPLGVLLTEHLEIRTPSRALLTLVADRGAALDASWLPGKDVIDVVRLADLSADEVIDTLRPLQFRDYSIASSPLAHPDSVHLTVASVRYTDGNRRHGGVASTYLADRCAKVRVHLRPNTHFRLPAADVPIIMIGPGTGIAPFRAFLQERQARAAGGRSWLFFGDRRHATDFLYGDELAGFVASGALTRLDLAFSRDQQAKLYVQHRMQENASELYSWLQDGAYLYVCGDADRMAKDVDTTLHDIVARCGGVDADAAHAYVNELVKTHRYVRDVY
ncbi:sulfite reductase flavoprotein subunit alpha [Mycobacterium sp. 21AC1]|uniref:diflavin oxidoreductase n=1 Tax=[Mycobacterium] appelbergii TaxID=2939269 RepID=UPI002938E471|nr:sulfite reductase flavoprotein subunit alpha [Mycobacterium sp. 21AC1]MDV3127219.1 sulfite reductase flavoprotein subunit alpha [Mycobacterium sp. 21AC1]